MKPPQEKGERTMNRSVDGRLLVRLDALVVHRSGASIRIGHARINA
jgi:hypothetical protein